MVEIFPRYSQISFQKDMAPVTWPMCRKLMCLILRMAMEVWQSNEEWSPFLEVIYTIFRKPGFPKIQLKWAN